MSARFKDRIGVLVPFTNTNLEPDMAMMCPPDVGLYTVRMGGYDADEIPDQSQMQGLGSADLNQTLELIRGVKPDVVVYGCTSATLTHGTAFDAALGSHMVMKTFAKPVTAARAIVHAVHALKSNKVGLATPYVLAINDLAEAFLADSGLQVVARAEMTDTLDNTGQGALTPDEVFELGVRADGPEVEAIVLSCTDMRSVEIIDRLEEATGKPVVTSNQAIMFDSLRRLGRTAPIEGFGKLLRRG